MKHLFILAILCLSSIAVTYGQISQENFDYDQYYKENIIKYNSFFDIMRLDGERLNFKDRRSIMMTYPESSVYYSKYNTWRKVEMSFGVATIATWITAAIIDRRSGEASTVLPQGLYTTSMILCTSGIISNIISTSYAKKAAKAYNKEVLRPLW